MTNNSNCSLKQNYSMYHNLEIKNNIVRIIKKVLKYLKVTNSRMARIAKEN